MTSGSDSDKLLRMGVLPPLDDEIASLLPRLEALRRDLHRHPELGFEEHRTQSVVRSLLESYGYAPRTMAETGLVADLHPGHPGPTIALRADMDALPLDEETSLPHRSVHAGRAHKCGHDGHTAILVGVAAALASRRSSVDGNVRLIFQPAEEGVRGGGARVMVAEGVLEGVREVYGLHNWPAFPVGEVRVKAGPVMAQDHHFEVELTGVGGHGSQPEVCRDPIVAGAHLVTALQTVISRGLGHEGGAVVSVCTFHAGSAHNVIPERVRLTGTIRSFAPAVSERVLARFEEVTLGVAQAFGVEPKLRLEPGYPVLNNDPECAEAVRRVAASLLGEGHVQGAGLPIAGGEDFAYFARERPGAYFFLGAGRPGEFTPGCHHPDFDFNDALIPLGIKLFLGLVETRLSAR
jgi:amidohydrolase